MERRNGVVLGVGKLGAHDVHQTPDGRHPPVHPLWLMTLVLTLPLVNSNLAKKEKAQN